MPTISSTIAGNLIVRQIFIAQRVDVIHNYAVIKNVSGHSRVCNLQPRFGPASDKRPTASLANDLMGAKLIAAFVVI